MRRSSFIAFAVACAAGCAEAGTAGNGGARPRSAEEIAAASPFGVYSPWGEMVTDHVTFATPQQVAGWIQVLGVKWGSVTLMVGDEPLFLRAD